MKSLHAIQRALVLGLSMAGWGGAYAANIVGSDGDESFASTSRMSINLTMRLAEATLQSRPTSSGASTKQAEARFDIAVRNAPAAQVFAQIGAGSNYNVLVPPDLSGSISLTLKNTTMHEALDTLREMYGYDYRITGNRVFVSSNTVQTRLYRINYLPGRRMGSSELSISSAAQATASGSSTGGAASTGASASGAANSGGGGNSLTSSVRTTSDADFWKDVSDSLTSLVGNKDGRSVTLNPGAGVILVRATPAELRQVTEYLRAVQLTIERQVMLEAKIVEVQLSKGSETGINWGAFRSQGADGHVGLVNLAPGVTLTSKALSNSNVSVTPGTGVSSTATGKGFYGLAIQTPNFAALLSFLETQGNVQVLSSPRIAALNNQKAVLKVGSDDTFVTSVTNNVSVVNNTTVNSPTVGTKTYFSGISLDVTPQIDDNGTVMLHVHPAISMATTKNLSLQLGDSGTYQVPGVAVSINETDSMVRVRDGQIVAIGGLMQQSGSLNSAGLPGLSEAPVVGGLFRYKSTSNTKRELVILIKPTVISDDGPGVNPLVPATPLLDQETASN